MRFISTSNRDTASLFRPPTDNRNPAARGSKLAGSALPRFFCSGARYHLLPAARCGVAFEGRHHVTRMLAIGFTPLHSGIQPLHSMGRYSDLPCFTVNSDALKPGARPADVRLLCIVLFSTKTAATRRALLNYACCAILPLARALAVRSAVAQCPCRQPRNCRPGTLSLFSL